jgi:hypothetical protein
MVLETTGHALSNSGTIEATNGGWLLVSHSTITDTATAHSTASGANSLVELDTATVNGGIVSVGAGAFMETVSGGTSTITAAVSDAGTVGAFNSSHLAITGAVTGAGDAHIGAAGVLEFAAASSTNVIFETFGSNHTGTLMLDTATKTTSQFSGTISNFANGNDIDLGAINFTTGKAELSFNTGTK